MTESEYTPITREFIETLTQRAKTTLLGYGVEISPERLQALVSGLLAAGEWRDFLAEGKSLERFEILHDERVSVPVLTTRLHDQAAVLVKFAGLSEADACDVVAVLRATADPDGPHAFDSRSSAISGIGKIEYRGLHPDTGPLVYKNGVLEPLYESWLGELTIRERALSRLTTGSPSVLGSINRKVFMGEDRFWDVHEAVEREGYSALFSATDGISITLPAGTTIVGPVFRPRLQHPVAA